MKRKHIIGQILYALVAIFVVCYIAGVVWNSLYNPVKTVSAIHMTTNDSIEVEGFVVREERVLDAVASGVVEMQVEEGERAAKGDAVAYVYANQDELERVHSRKELNARITRLKNLMNQGNEVVDLNTVDNSIVRLSEEMIDYYSNGDFTRIPELVEQLKDKTLSREYVYRDRAELEGVIKQLESERDAIDKVSAQRAIYASNPGYYSSQSDGYESVLTCGKVSELTPTKYKEIEKSDVESTQNDGTLGKIITEFYWDFVTMVDQEAADRMQVGKNVRISFDSPQYPEVDARVQWKSESEDGRVVVALRADEYISEFTVARKLRASIVIKTYEGLKVPREALRVNEEGVQGVYCLIDSQVKFKEVNPIFEKDSYYIVSYDSTDTKGLLLFDEIVIAAKELEDRKMVK